MMATTLAVTFSVLVIRFHYKSPENKPPQWLRIFFFHYLARFVCMDHRGKYSRLIARKKPATVHRDLTWSDTITEDIRSQNSHAGTLSPGPLTPEGPDEIELLHKRGRRLHDSGLDHNSAHLGGDHQSTSQDYVEHHTTYINEGLSAHAMNRTGLVIVNEWRMMAEIMDRFFFWLFLY